MDFGGLLLIAIGLSMDAFAVSIGKGLATPRFRWRNGVTCGLWFGGFQALMPLLGYLLGTTFSGYIQAIDHWIAFVLLSLIGGNMIREALSVEDADVDSSYSVLRMLPLAVATSIDALAVGVTFAFLQVDIWVAVLQIGVTTCLLSIVGVRIGSVFGEKYAARAEIFGGVLLILMGARMLLEHLGVF